MKKKNNSLSIVIPVYYDEEVLSELYKRLSPVIKKLTDNYEIIFIDDGSKDNSFEILYNLYKQDDHIKILKQARNFGQANSILAGLQYASNEIIIIMDSDLQDKPEDIPILIDSLIENNVSMAIAKWETRKDSLRKKLASWLFYKFSQKVTNIKYEKGLGVFRAIKREPIKDLLNMSETTGTILSLLYWSGISYIAVPLQRDKRLAGTSGYNLKKMLSLTADRIFSYSFFPIKLITNTGILIGSISILLAFYYTIRKLCGAVSLSGWTSLIVIISFLFGLNFIFIGLLGEYIGRIYFETKNRPKYVTEIILDKTKGGKND